LNKKLLTYFAIIISISFFSCKNKNEKIVTQEIQPNPFNLEIQGLISVVDTIKQNETITDIFTPHGLSAKTIHEIETKALNIFPLRKFKAGNQIYIYAKWDSVETVKYFVYPIDEINYVVYDLRDSIKIYQKQKPHFIKEEIVSGKIQDGLILDLKKIILILKLDLLLQIFMKAKLILVYFNQAMNIKSYSNNITLKINR